MHGCSRIALFFQQGISTDHRRLVLLFDKTDDLTCAPAAERSILTRLPGSIRAAIAFSGSVLLDADYIRDPKKDATELAASVGCPTRTSNELVSCLKRMPVQKLLSAAKGFEEGNPNIAPYAFVLDHVHFKDAPRKALEAAIRFANRGPNYITGYLREDFSFLLAISSPDVFDPKKPLTLATVKEIVAYGFLPNGNIPQCAEPNYELAQKVMDQYNMSAKDSRSSLLLKLFRLTTDVVFGYPAAKESQMYTRRQGSAANANQMFRISYDPKYNDLGAFHTYDLPNIFSPAMQLPNLRLNPRVVSSIRSMLRQVAHNGRMDGPSFGTRGQYMELGQSGEWRTGTYDHLPLVEFWDRVYAAPCPSSTRRTG